MRKENEKLQVAAAAVEITLVKTTITTTIVN